MPNLRTVIFCLLPVVSTGCEPDSVSFYADGSLMMDASPIGDSMATADAETPQMDALTQDDGGQSPAPCGDTQWTIAETHFVAQCGTATMRLTPSVLANGEWRVANECMPTETTVLACRYEGFGLFEIQREGNVFQGRYTADFDHVFGGARLAGTLYLPEADAWLSNGYQSWSQSGVIQIPPSISVNERTVALGAQNDVEVIRNGRENSWWHTFVHGQTSMVAGAITANTFPSWIGVSGIPPNLDVELTSGQTGEEIQIQSGQSRIMEGWYVTLAADINDALRTYSTYLPTRATSAAAPEAGWNSWYELFDGVDETAVRENAALVAQHLVRRVPETVLPLRVVIDDGWQNAWGDWTANEKFPSGLTALAGELTAQGLAPGIWLAPFLVDQNLPLVTEQPNWFVRGVTFNHIRYGEMRVLDVTHPGAAEHLRGVIRRLVEAGFTQLKLDFLFAATYGGEHFEDVTGLEAYNRGMQLIREAAGPDTALLAVGTPPIAAFDQIDVWRMGPDITVQVFDATWFFMPNVGRSVAARWPYCLTTLCDGDPILLRSLPQNEVQVGAWTAAFAGGALFLSDDLRVLPGERVDYLETLMIEQALSGQPAVPDPVPLEIPETLTTALTDQIAMESRHQVPHRWTLSNGQKIMINWRDHPQEVGAETYPGRSATVLDEP